MFTCDYYIQGNRPTLSLRLARSRPTRDIVCTLTSSYSCIIVTLKVDIYVVTQVCLELSRGLVPRARAGRMPHLRRSPLPLSLERILRGVHKTAIGKSSNASQQRKPDRSHQYEWHKHTVMTLHRIVVISQTPYTRETCCKPTCGVLLRC